MVCAGISDNTVWRWLHPPRPDDARGSMGTHMAAPGIVKGYAFV